MHVYYYLTVSEGEELLQEQLSRKFCLGVSWEVTVKVQAGLQSHQGLN